MKMRGKFTSSVLTGSLYLVQVLAVYLIKLSYKFGFFYTRKINFTYLPKFTDLVLKLNVGNNKYAEANGRRAKSTFKVFITLHSTTLKVIKVTQTNASSTFSLRCNTAFLVMFLDYQQCNQRSKHKG